MQIKGTNRYTFTLCRFLDPKDRAQVGLVRKHQADVGMLSEVGIEKLEDVINKADPVFNLNELLSDAIIPSYGLTDIRLLPPVENQEVWAAGVTYEDSKRARMAESKEGASHYDRVYSAPRPELFFKANAKDVVGHGDSIGIRDDSKWSVPEPELALVINSVGKIVGYTIGNDVSARDIEGENPLYLPQAKVYEGSCALGPWIEVGAAEEVAREWDISVDIGRSGGFVFNGGPVQARKIVRPFDSLAEYLFHSKQFPNGAVLLTGTGIVPPNEFTLKEKDEVTISISGIGSLKNPVTVV